MSLNDTIQATLSQTRGFTTTTLGCAFADDNSFGPSVAKQCRAFDFTLLFEQAFLSLIPSILFVLGSVVRLISIARQDVKTSQSRWHISKLVPMCLFRSLEFFANETRQL
jgi:ATP-binding cassette subfamily C (CFTR/MRP) protein 1